MSPPTPPPVPWSTDGLPGRAPFLGMIDLGTCARHAVARREWYPVQCMVHPGKMVVELARWLIERYSRPGQRVLDPMAGIGTTLIEALRLNRCAAGVELERRWAMLARAALDQAKRRLPAALRPGAVWFRVGNAKHLRRLLPRDAPYHLILTSPPFGPTGHHPGRHSEMQHRIIRDLHLTGAMEDYGDHPDQIGNHDRPYGSVAGVLSGEDRACGPTARSSFLYEWAAILGAFARVPPANGLVLVHIKNFVRQARVVRLDLDTVTLAEAGGLHYVGYHLRPIRPGFYQHVQRKRNPAYPLVEHEHVLVFRRPDAP